MKDDSQTWRDRLLKAVEATPKTRETIAVEAGLGRAYLYGVFKEGKVPSIENLVAICSVLGVSPAFILFGWSMTEKQQELLDLLSRDPGRTEAVLQLLRSTGTGE